MVVCQSHMQRSRHAKTNAAQKTHQREGVKQDSVSPVHADVAPSPLFMPVVVGGGGIVSSSADHDVTLSSAPERGC